MLEFTKLTTGRHKSMAILQCIFSRPLTKAFPIAHLDLIREQRPRVSRGGVRAEEKGAACGEEDAARDGVQVIARHPPRGAPVIGQ